MTVHLIGLSVFVLLFILSMVRPISMGILGFAAAFLVGLFVTGTNSKEIVGGFPADLFVILVGVTLLFGLAQANGTVQHLVDWGVRLIKGRVALLPWLMFVLAATLCGIGALGPAVVSILFPIGMAFAATHHIRPLLIGIMVSFGCTAGSFSPIGLFGIIVNQTLTSNGLYAQPVSLFLIVFAGGVLVGIIGYFTTGGLALMRSESKLSDADKQGDSDGSGAAVPRPGPTGSTLTKSSMTTTAVRASEEKLSTTLEQKLTVGALIVLVVGAIGFDLDIGLLAITLAAGLGLAFSSSIKEATQHISWSVVLLLGGVITYVGVLDGAGTIDWLGEAASGFGSPLIAALLICFIAAAVSAFASTTGMLGALVPLCVPLLQMGHIGVLGFAAALSLSASLVDTSPFSTVGAVAIASAPEEERQQVYRNLLKVGMGLVVLTPLITWAVLIVPGWL